MLPPLTVEPVFWSACRLTAKGSPDTEGSQHYGDRDAQLHASISVELDPQCFRQGGRHSETSNGF